MGKIRVLLCLIIVAVGSSFFAMAEAEAAKCIRGYVAEIYMNNRAGPECSVSISSDPAGTNIIGYVEPLSTISYNDPHKYFELLNTAFARGLQVNVYGPEIVYPGGQVCINDIWTIGVNASWGGQDAVGKLTSLQMVLNNFARQTTATLKKILDLLTTYRIAR